MKVKVVKNRGINKNLVISSNRKIDFTLVNKSIKVHNGQLYNNIVVSEKMIGHYAGEFITTKRQGYMIHIHGRKTKRVKKTK